ncbi:PilZ domain-containing protein [Sphingomonas sp. 28-63-12]|uniref:PilZ domain-containing protein n=1 Tax=Sphingomonas sp. 28-63-12 TaxID=1970434 RepID=UPI000BCA61FF|nr:MAG: hypothetical protein B7Y47_12695 [Sphingomonas sp. 28-63-12]
MASRATQYRKVEPALVEQRLSTRHKVVIDRASVRRRGKLPCEALLFDLSIYGCRLETAAKFRAEDRILVGLPGAMPVAAIVIWAERGQVGCRFDTAIDRAVVRALTLVIV